MRAIDWQQFLQNQRDQHGKVLFTATELANASGAEPRSLSVALQRLVTRGVIARYATGKYGLPGVVAAEALVPELDTAAYITGMYALHRHHIVTQAPTEIACFTNHRHNRSRVRNTPVGRIVLICVSTSIYSYPEGGAMASPEQSLCDFVHICRRRGVSAFSIATFRNLDRLNRDELLRHLKRYPESVQRETERLIRPTAS